MSVGGPSLAILRYGVTASFPMPRIHVLDPAARGHVKPGGPYGFIGTCTACPNQALGLTLSGTADAIRRHLRKHFT